MRTKATSIHQGPRKKNRIRARPAVIPKVPLRLLLGFRRGTGATCRSRRFPQAAQNAASCDDANSAPQPAQCVARPSREVPTTAYVAAGASAFSALDLGAFLAFAFFGAGAFDSAAFRALQ